MFSFLRALGFLSILPVGALGRFERADIPGMLAAFPLAGAVLGALLGLGWDMAAWYFPPTVAAVLTVAAWTLFTRALHLDGLADCADGLGGSYDRDKRLAIMKDPHAGTFAITTIVLALGLKIAAVHQLTLHSRIVPPTPGWLDVDPLGWRVWLLALILASARWVTVAAGLNAKYARAEGGLGQDFVSAINLKLIILGACVPLLLVLLAGGNGNFGAASVVASMLAVAVLLRAAFQGALGGLTGDTLGATVELSEIVALLVCCSRYSPLAPGI